MSAREIYGVRMSTKIYVGNLSYKIADHALNDLFAEHGSVASAKVIMDRETDRSKGFGFVEMSTSSEAATAINALNGVEIDGRALNVSEAKPMEPRSNSQRRY